MTSLKFYTDKERATYLEVMLKKRESVIETTGKHRTIKSTKRHLYNTILTLFIVLVGYRVWSNTQSKTRYLHLAILLE